MDDFPEPTNADPKPWHENPYFILPASFVGLILLLAIFFLAARLAPERPASADDSPATATAVLTAVSPSPLPSLTPAATAKATIPPTTAPTTEATATSEPTAVPPTATVLPSPSPTIAPSRTATAMPPTAVPPTATAIPRPVGGFPALSLDAWELPGQEFCQAAQGYRAIFMEGHGGDGLYSYYWNDEPISEPLYQQSFTYQAPVGGGSSQGQIKVVSGDGKIAIVILFLKGLECPN